MSRAAVLVSIVMVAGCLEYDLHGPDRAPAPQLEQEDSVPTVTEGTPPQEDAASTPADPSAPVAVCSVAPSPVEALYETATWIGSASYDPEGRPLTYEWILTEVPPGANPVTPSGGPQQPDRPGFLPDLVGLYTGQLIVTNDLGVSSEPCEAVLEAIPANDLWVEMYWAERGDDMDLHLVRGAGTLASNQDCHYQNCRFFTLDWGPSGPAGDPSLDIDDIDGTGPENINIESPEELTYEVLVHDFPGSRYTPANDVTVNIWLSGVHVFSETRAITGENTFEHFATIDWAAGSVTPQ